MNAPLVNLLCHPSLYTWSQIFDPLEAKWQRNAVLQLKAEALYKLTCCWQVWPWLGTTEASVLWKEKRNCFLMIQHKRQTQPLREGRHYSHEISPSPKGLVWHWLVAPEVILPSPSQSPRVHMPTISNHISKYQRHWMGNNCLTVREETTFNQTQTYVLTSSSWDAVLLSSACLPWYLQMCLISCSLYLQAAIKL